MVKLPKLLLQEFQSVLKKNEFLEFKDLDSTPEFTARMSSTLTTAPCSYAEILVKITLSFETPEDNAELAMAIQESADAELAARFYMIEEAVYLADEDARLTRIAQEARIAEENDAALTALAALRI